MKEKVIKLIVKALVVIAFFIVLGVLALGSYVVQPENTMFTFTVFGVSAIVFYNTFREVGLKNFLYLGSLFSLLMIIIFLHVPDFIVLFKDVLWFILIGLLSMLIVLLEKNSWFNKMNFWTIASWFFGFILIYIIMVPINVYLLGLYKTTGRFTINLYFELAVKIGAVLGFGIGAGNVLGKYISMKFSDKTSDSNQQENIP